MKKETSDKRQTMVVLRSRNATHVTRFGFYLGRYRTLAEIAVNMTETVTLRRLMKHFLSVNSKYVMPIAKASEPHGSI